MAKPNSANVVILGALHIEVIAAVDQLPSVGESSSSSELIRRFGGRAGAQAIAAARQGAQVTLLGALGDDAEGRSYRDQLRCEGVNCSALQLARGVHTGTVFITKDKAAQQLRVLIPGANATLTSPSIKLQRAKIAVAHALLLNLELPQEAVLEAMKLAHEMKIPIMLYLPPGEQVKSFPWQEAPEVDLVVMQLAVAKQRFSGEKTETWCQQLPAQKMKRLVCLDNKGRALLVQPTGVVEAATPDLPAHADESGWEEIFMGTLTAHLAEAQPITEALSWALTAAVLAAREANPMEGIPYRGDVQAAFVDKS
jgi:ribokinase